MGPETADLTASIPRPRPPLDPDDARDLLALAFESSPLGMSLSAVPSLDQAASGPRAMLINNAFAQMLGYTVDELLDLPDQGRLTHDEDRAADLVHVEAVVGGRQQTARWDKRYLHSDGHVVWGRVSI